MEVSKDSLLNVTWQDALHIQGQYVLDKFTQHHITCAYTYSCFTASNLWGHKDLKKGQNIKRDTRISVRKGNKIEHDFPGGSDRKASAYNVGNPGSIPGLGRSPGEGNGNPLQYSCLENSMDGGAW